jgi:hypothetical protein
MADHVERTIEMVQEQIAQLEQQLLEKKRMVNGLSVLAGKPEVYADAESVTTSAVIRPDEFYGQSLTVAAREILERRARAKQGAAAVGDIYDVLVAGGYHFKAKNEANAKRTLYQILGKNPDVFHKLPSGHYGLREWYSNIREAKDTNGADEGDESEADLDQIKAEGGFDKPTEPEAPKGTAASKGGGKETAKAK